MHITLKATGRDSNSLDETKKEISQRTEMPELSLKECRNHAERRNREKKKKGKENNTYKGSMTPYISHYMV